MYNNCGHKNLKYFEQTNKVICLDCGKSFEEYIQPTQPNFPLLPDYPTSPSPDYPYYPIVTWNKIDN